MLGGKLRGDVLDEQGRPIPHCVHDHSETEGYCEYNLKDCANDGVCPFKQPDFPPAYREGFNLFLACSRRDLWSRSGMDGTRSHINREEMNAMAATLGIDITELTEQVVVLCESVIKKQDAEAARLARQNAKVNQDNG
jgi:hypothetical protein